MFFALNSEDKIHKSGWLKKQGGIVKSWQQRWFVLKGKKLLYYTKEDELKQHGAIELGGSAIKELPFNRDEPEKWLFEIIIPNKDAIVIWAKDDEQRTEWVSAIRRAIYSGIGGGVFGGELERVVNFDRDKFGYDVPHVVQHTIDIIRRDGIEMEGIFRLSGRLSQVKELKRAYDEGNRPDLKDIGLDVHSLASLLKMYLRDLPEPVIPFNQFENFLSLATSFRYNSNHAETLHSLRRLIWELPKANFDLLKMLSQFLYEISQSQHINKMTESNISLIFGTNILRSDDDSPEFQMATQNLTTQVVLALVKWQEHIFSEFLPEIMKEPLASPVPNDILLNLNDDESVSDPVLDVVAYAPDPRATILDELSDINFAAPDPDLEWSPPLEVKPPRSKAPPAIPPRKSEVEAPEAASLPSPSASETSDTIFTGNAEIEPRVETEPTPSPAISRPIPKPRTINQDQQKSAVNVRESSLRRSNRPMALVAPKLSETEDNSVSAPQPQQQSQIQVDSDLPDNAIELKVMVSELRLKFAQLEKELKSVKSTSEKQEAMFKQKAAQLAELVHSEQRSKDEALNKIVSLNEQLIKLQFS